MKKIAILSVPRSGSSWVGQIFNSSREVQYKFQPNFAYSFPFSLIKKSNQLMIEEFYDHLINCDDPFVNGEISISGKENIQFPKSNINTLVWKEVHFLFAARALLEKSDTKIIGLLRSPFAVISSWVNIPKEFNPSWNISEQWKDAPLKNQNSINNFFGYNKWKEITNLFVQLKNEFPDRIYLLNYDDLLMDPIGEVKRLFSFCDLELETQTLEFLIKSSKVNDSDAYSVFKSKIKDDDWKVKLPSLVIDEINNDPEFQALNHKFNWI